MKKTLLLLSVALLTGFAAVAQVTDTIVSKQPSNKNVVLEEYTGIYCQYCPDGHKIANQIAQANPGRVFLINIHEGGYANNTYTTSFGTALANQTNLQGYPSGTINRHVFSGNATALSRNMWQSCANQIMAQTSPVNIAADGTLDYESRELTIRVQLYYTGSQTVTSNMLNIAVIQDNVLGQQTAGATYNPSQIVNGQYNHMHMLRHLITGQWGETIDNVAQGTFVEKTFTYTIPEQLGSPNPINAVLEDLSFIAFVAEGHQEILTGTKVDLDVNYPQILAKASLKEGANESQDCSDSYNAYLEVLNLGMAELSSVTYEYTLNGVTNTVERSVSFPHLASDTIQLPALDVNINQNTPVTAKITKLNGENVDMPTQSITINKKVVSEGGYMYFLLYTDRYGSETTFKFIDENGNVVLKGGPFSNLSSNTTAMHEFDFLPSEVGCYRLEVYDEYGDGINAGYGSGYFELRNAAGEVLFHNDGKFGSSVVYYLDVTAPVDIEDFTAESATVYPNPATDMINISGTDVQRVEIYNMQGQLVKVADNATVSVKDLSAGIYSVKVVAQDGTSMHKIVKR